MAVATSTAGKLTDLRIQRALAKPGAYGMKGFLLWTEAAWPPAIAQKILQAASKYTPGAGPLPGAFSPTLASPANQGFGRFGRLGFLGDDSGIVDVSFDPSSLGVSSDVTSAIAAANDPTMPPVSATTSATSSQPASASWASDIGSAVTAATTAALGIVQVNDAQKIFNTNLQRAQQGLAPIPTNPTTYGLPAPTANIGLTSGTTSTLLLLGGLLAAGLVLSSFAGKKS